MGQALALLENLKLIYFPSYCGHKLHRSHYLTRSLQLCVSLSHRLSLFVYGAPSRPLSLPVSPSHALSTQSLQIFAINFDFAFSAFPIFAHLFSMCLSTYLPTLPRLPLSLSLSLSLLESTDCSVAQSTNYAALTSPLSVSLPLSPRAFKIGMPKVRRKTFQFNYQRPGTPDCHPYATVPHSSPPLPSFLFPPLGQQQLQFRFGFDLPAIWLSAFSANLFAKFACWRHRHRQRRQRNLRGCRLRQQHLQHEIMLVCLCKTTTTTTTTAGSAATPRIEA